MFFSIIKRIISWFVDIDSEELPKGYISPCILSESKCTGDNLPKFSRNDFQTKFNQFIDKSMVDVLVRQQQKHQKDVLIHWILNRCSTVLDGYLHNIWTENKQYQIFYKGEDIFYVKLKKIRWYDQHMTLIFEQSEKQDLPLEFRIYWTKQDQSFKRLSWC